VVDVPASGGGVLVPASGVFVWFVDVFEFEPPQPTSAAWPTATITKSVARADIGRARNARTA
jgi:hypothetical protein